YIGSSANPGYRDFAIAAEIVKDRTIAPGMSFDINPTSRQMLTNLVKNMHIASLLQSGARLHQAGCNGCIGMGQAPASGQNSYVQHQETSQDARERLKIVYIYPALKPQQYLH